MARSIADHRLAVGVLAVGLVLTVAVSGFLSDSLADDRRAELDGMALQARTAIERRVASYAEPLYGMSAVLSGAQPTGRAGFHRYVELAGTARREPGLLVYTFNRLVPTGEVPDFEEAVRTDTSLMAEGYPEFRVHPRTGVGPGVIIDFVEPRAGNEAIIGFDVTSDPVRRDAVEAARDGGRLVATAPVNLLQDGGGPGILLFLPVYRTAQVPDTGPARRRHFAGLVTAGVSLEQMLANVLGGSTAERPGIRLRIYDVGPTIGEPGPVDRDRTVVFDSDPLHRRGQRDQDGSRSLDLSVGGRRWRLIVAPGPDLGSGHAALMPWVAGAGGCVLSVLLSGLLLSLAGSKQRAVSLAAGMTTSLRRREGELRKANLQLAESNAALARADQVKDSFLGTMSHELRTPLTAISGFVRLLQGRWASLDPEERQESLTRIARSADALGRLVDDLLEFNRTGDQAPALSLVKVDLALVAQEAVDGLGPLDTTHDIRLDTHPVDVLADHAAVARILTNLLTNAVKFSPEGTPVTVTIRSGEGMGIIEVADRGPGVPPDQRVLVFDRFYRGTQDGLFGRPGTGIGLAVVKDLVDRLGGSVRIDDGPQGGAVFQVTLPLSSGSALGDAVGAPQPERVS